MALDFMISTVARLVLVVGALVGCAQEQQLSPCAPAAAGRFPSEKDMRACLGDGEYERILAEKKAQAAIEAAACAEESAQWFGATGLPESTERHLAEYLRLEFGEPCSSPGSLRASDLEYRGVFPDTGGETHFWAIRGKTSGELVAFAYVEVRNGVPVLTGWGNKKTTNQESAG